MDTRSTTSPKLSGLTDDAVKQSREKFGRNTTDIEIHNRFWPVVRDIITEPLFIILVGTATLYFILGEYSEGMIMLMALGFVSGISLYQENRSRNAVASLKRLSSPRAKVIRNGTTQEIPSEEVVIGDLLVVEDGNLIQADARILEAHDFSVNESILTGESLAVFKDASEPPASIFHGTLVMTGSCIAQVEAIGNLTALGKIGQSLEDIDVTSTPLQRQIKSFIRSLVTVGFFAFVLVWGITSYQSNDWLHGLLQGLTLAMSVLPEEIPVAFSTFMALGAYHLYKKRVITRSPHTVETLGAASVICIDKTGTITENEMRLSAFYDFSEDKTCDLTKGPPENARVLEYAMWASETEPFDRMEKSILEVYTSVAAPDKRLDYRLIREYPLGGNPPLMTHVYGHPQSTPIIAVKGALEGILRQTHLPETEQTKIRAKANEFAAKGFRVLGVGKSGHPVHRLPAAQFEFEFDFVGLVAFYDPPKKNIEEIFRQFDAAGIQVKMVTGDHAETALAIANQVKLKNNSLVLTGNEILKLSDAQLRKQVGQVNIYARMFPDAKLKVIEALKANGEVVAMTGDGVNDGPALKAAHIGIAMGLHGSEVAKNAASLILMDDDLSHMTEAVAQGRRIYENLKKAIQYIISIHIPIILIVMLPLIFAWKFTTLFSPIHVIFLELIMGPTCSIIFENEPIEGNSMRKKPRKISTSFFSLQELSMSIVQGAMITMVCLALGFYFITRGSSESETRTVIYSTLVFSNLFLTLVNRSFYYSVVTTVQYKNRLIPLVLIISLVVLLLSLYARPVQALFKFVPLGVSEVSVCLAAAFAGVMWVEIYKMIKRRSREKGSVSAN